METQTIDRCHQVGMKTRVHIGPIPHPDPVLSSRRLQFVVPAMTINDASEQTRKCWMDGQFRAPVPAFIDTGGTLVDKSSVPAFLSAQQSATGSHK
jgi:hypothetical protein